MPETTAPNATATETTEVVEVEQTPDEPQVEQVSDDIAALDNSTSHAAPAATEKESAPATGDPGDEDVEIVPVKEAAPAFDDEDLQVIGQFGITKESLQQQFGGDARKAYRAIAMHAAQRLSQQPQNPAPVPTTNPGPGAMPAGGDEPKWEFDPDRDGPEKIVQVAKSAYEHNALAVQRAAHAVREIESKFGAMQQAYAALANQHAASRIREVDNLIAKLPPVWKGTLGQGSTPKLDRKSPEFANRQKLVAKVLQMEREALANGDVPDMEQLFETARTSLWTTQVRREIADEQKQKLKQSSQRTIQRPAAKKPGTATPAKKDDFTL